MRGEELSLAHHLLKEVTLQLLTSPYGQHLEIATQTHWEVSSVSELHRMNCAPSKGESKCCATEACEQVNHQDEFANTKGLRHLHPNAYASIYCSFGCFQRLAQRLKAVILSAKLQYRL